MENLNKITPNINPNAIDPRTKDPYLIDEKEAGLYHVLITEKTHNINAAEYNSSNRIVKYQPHTYNQCTSDSGKFGNAVSSELIHDGKKWTTSQKESKANSSGLSEMPSEEVKADYYLVFGETIPEEITMSEAVAAIDSGCEQIEEKTKEAYLKTFNRKPGNKKVITLLRELNKND